MSVRAGGSTGDASAGRVPGDHPSSSATPRCARTSRRASSRPPGGDPESPLRWTTRSVRNLAAELVRQGHAVSRQTVSELLHDLGYSLQSNRTVLEGTSHPDRDAQFAHLNAAVQLQLSLGEPVISVDTKKKELVGPFRNGGKELRPRGRPGAGADARLRDRRPGSGQPLRRL
jgi:Rhodopirellula transposase DDE domain